MPSCLVHGVVRSSTQAMEVSDDEEEKIPRVPSPFKEQKTIQCRFHTGTRRNS